MLVWIVPKSSLFEHLNSLLDYARLLREDPSAVDMVIDRVEKVEAALRDTGMTWMDLKRAYAEVDILMVKCSDPH